MQSRQDTMQPQNISIGPARIKAARGSGIGKIMNESVAKAFIVCGWVAAGISCVGNLLVATRTGGLNFPNLILTLAFAAITYGMAPTHGGSAFMTSFWVSTAIFMSAFLLAVIGTFAWHSRQSARSAKSAASDSSK
jgi:uncharacterized membrane protein